jgi:hypothetical protein
MYFSRTIWAVKLFLISFISSIHNFYQIELNYFQLSSVFRLLSYLPLLHSLFYSYNNTDYKKMY